MSNVIPETRIIQGERLDRPMNHSATQRRAVGTATDESERHTPVVLMGMPRSGTTWIGKILDSSPRTLYRHEPDSYGRLNALPLAPRVSDWREHAEDVSTFFASVAGARDTKIAGSAPVFSKDYQHALQALWNTAAVFGTKGLTRFMGEMQVPLWLPRGNPDGYRLVVKSIESLPRSGVIARALPHARLILLLRNPYGFIASMLRGKSQGLFSDSGSIGEDLKLLGLLVEADEEGHDITLEALGDATPAQRLAWQWVLSNDKALRDTEACDNVAAIRYEDVCADPLGATERLFAACDLPLTEQTRRFIRSSTGGHRDRYYSVYKDPLKAANAWRSELSSDVVDSIRPILARSRAGSLYADDL
ncbi:MAG: sulfotransferase [Spiribacter salinus]|uniref:Sulfotransferase n=1 Tax=Spiribacter salinus TaxID=1335746 RepID=A0A540VQH0_9GAMM|nr:MAG: sulfotransferase [Spiribacter salinus]